MCLILPISCWHVTRLSRHSIRLMNEWQSLHHSQSKVVCHNIFGFWLLKHWKIHIPYRQRCLNFPRGGIKPRCRKKNRKLHIYSVALAMAFLVAENENQLLEDLPQANVGLVPERFLLLVRTKSITENFVCWKLHPLFVLEVCQCILFIMSFSTNTLFIFGDCRCFYFHSLIKLTFLVSKGLLCLYDKQNNTW